MKQVTSFIIGIIVGGAVILLLYSHFVLPWKDSQINLLRQENSLLESPCALSWADLERWTEPNAIFSFQCREYTDANGMSVPYWTTSRITD